jgi:hypothetical protein
VCGNRYCCECIVQLGVHSCNIYPRIRSTNARFFARRIAANSLMSCTHQTKHTRQHNWKNHEPKGDRSKTRAHGRGTTTHTIFVCCSQKAFVMDNACHGMYTRADTRGTTRVCYRLDRVNKAANAVAKSGASTRLQRNPERGSAKPPALCHLKCNVDVLSWATICEASAHVCCIRVGALVCG